MKKLLSFLLLISASAYGMNPGIQERVTQLETALAQAKAAGNDRRTSRILLRLGRSCYRLEQYDKAGAYINELLAFDRVDPRDKQRAERLQTLIAQHITA